MALSPLPNLSQLSSYKATGLIDSYRAELAAADDGAADLNKSKDLVEIRYDSTVLTARLKPTGFETRSESKAGVTVNLDEYSQYTYSHANKLTSVTKSAQGAYSGVRHTSSTDARVAASNEAVTPEEAEFLFNLHEPGLRPSSTTPAAKS